MGLGLCCQEPAPFPLLSASSPFWRWFSSGWLCDIRPWSGCRAGRAGTPLGARCPHWLVRLVAEAAAETSLEGGNMALAIFIPVLIISLLLGGAYIYITRYGASGGSGALTHSATSVLGAWACHWTLSLRVSTLGDSGICVIEGMV